MKILPILMLACAAVGGLQPVLKAQQSPRQAALPLKTRSVLETIRGDELKGNLSFLASDALAGRFTPSPGLDIAAEFIASRFRAIGLEPGGNPDYFQVATMVERRLPKMASGLKVDVGGKTIDVPSTEIEIYQTGGAATIARAQVIGFATADIGLLKKTDITGKVVMHVRPDYRKLPHDKAMAENLKARAFGQAVRSSSAALEIILTEETGNRPAAKLISEEAARKRQTPVLTVSSAELRRWFDKVSASGGACQHKYGKNFQTGL